jgi:hypothetical protein
MADASGQGGGPRSDMYSGSRFSNWTVHDPTWSEMGALPAWTRPCRLVTGPDDGQISIFERPLSCLPNSSIVQRYT